MQRPKIKTNNPRNQVQQKPADTNRSPSREQQRELPAPEVRLPKGIVQAWQQTLLSCGRFPKGTRLNDTNPFQLTKVLAQQERHTITEIWEIFTSNRQDLKRGLLSQRQMVVAYLLGFHLPNFARTHMVLDRALKRFPLQTLWQGKDVEVIDYGCGTGALSQAMIWRLLAGKHKPGQVTATLNDSNRLLAQAAASILQNTVEERLTVRTILSPIEDFTLPSAPKSNLKIHLLGYVWNELENNPKARRQLLNNWSQACAKDESHIIIVLDPGNQMLSREVMTLRDHMQSQGYGMVYPCPHQMPCPMLAHSRDWCFSEAYWQRPQEQIMIDRLVTRDHGKIFTTGMIWVSPDIQRNLSPLAPQTPVVVGFPRDVKSSKSQTLTCDPDGTLGKSLAFSPESRRGATLKSSHKITPIQPRAPKED